MSLFGLGSTKEKSWIEPAVRAMQEQNYAGAQATPSTYTPTGPDLIARYFNPFQEQVTDRTLQGLERGRQMAVNTTGDQAQAAHAFGGSRHGVAEGLTNEGYARTAADTLANLNMQGFDTALGAARDENARSYQYPLTRQQVLNNTLQGVTPMTVRKKQDPGAAMDNFGGLLQTAGNIAAFFA